MSAILELRCNWCGQASLPLVATIWDGRLTATEPEFHMEDTIKSDWEIRGTEVMCVSCQLRGEVWTSMVPPPGSRDPSVDGDGIDGSTEAQVGTPDDDFVRITPWWKWLWAAFWQ